MVWSFATAKHGLGVAETRFWSLSPREYEALCYVYASDQALFHNAHFHREAGKFRVEEFMPGYSAEPTKAAWDSARDFESFRARFDPAKPQRQREMTEVAKQIGERMRRASEAQGLGATNEQVENILRGVL